MYYTVLMIVREQICTGWEIRSTQSDDQGLRNEPRSLDSKILKIPQLRLQEGTLGHGHRHLGIVRQAHHIGVGQ